MVTASIVLEKITFEYPNYDHVQIEFFLATKLKSPRNLIEARENYVRPYKSIKFTDLADAPKNLNISLQVNEDPENIKSCVLLINMYVGIVNNDHIKTDELQGVGFYDLVSNSEEVTLHSPLSLLSSTYLDPKHCGVKMNFHSSWKLSSTGDAKPALTPDSFVKNLFKKKVLSNEIIKKYREAYTSGYNKNIKSLNNAFENVFIIYYFFNGIMAYGPLFFQDIEAPMITDQFIEYMAQTTLLIRGNFKSFQAYTESQEFQTNPTVFWQTMVSLYSNGTCYSEDTAIDTSPPVYLNGSYPAAESKINYDYFELLTITGSGDCDDKGRFMLDMFYATQKYAARSAGDKTTKRSALQRILASVLDYDMFVVIIGYSSGTQTSSHITNVCIRKDVVKTVPSKDAPSKITQIVDCTHESDPSRPAFMILDSIHPSITLSTAFPLRNEKNLDKIMTVLDKWRPAQLDSRTYSGTALYTIIMKANQRDYQQAVIMRFFTNFRYNAKRMVAAAPQQSKDAYGFLAADITRNPITLTWSTVDENPELWEEQLDLLQYRHPPVELTPPTGVDSSGTKGLSDFRVLFSDGTPTESLFCVPVYIQKERKELPDNIEKSLVDAVKGDLKNIVHHMDTCFIRLESRNIGFLLYRLFIDPL